MSAAQTQAGDLFAGKTSIPAELRTAEWSMTSQWLRERSFYMAGVTRAEILDMFRGEASSIIEGETSEAESLRKIEDFLDGIGYQAEAGEEDTIKDLRTSRRILVALRTNVRVVQGWRRKERGLREAALRTFPCWELVRVEERKHERDWPTRWVALGGKLYNGRMIALKTDKIWSRLGSEFPDSLMVDHPPFAWSSGMGWAQVGRAEAIALGVLTDDAAEQESMPLSSPNENLELKPKVKSERVRKALADEMKGLAKWEGDKFVFTDPNGTRPYGGPELVEVWNQPMPDVFQGLVGKGQMQREAVRTWAEDHNQFRTENEGEAPPAGLDAQENLRRAFQRITPMNSGVTIYRGLTYARRAGGEEFESFREFLASLKGTGEYFPNPFKLADSWSLTRAGAEKYARAKPYSVVLVMNNHRSAKDISPIVRSFGNEVSSPDVTKPLVTDGEVVILKGARFRVLKIDVLKDEPKGGEAVVYVEQM